MEKQKTQNGQQNIKGKEQSQRTDTMKEQISGSIDQWNGIESPEIYPHKYSQLIFDKRAKTIQWRKDNLFQKMMTSNWVSI